MSPTAVANEFDAAIARSGTGDTVRVRRRWAQIDPTGGGHLSAVTWHKGPIGVVALHAAARSARAWDALAIPRSDAVVAVDLPGHGYSSWRGDANYSPGRLVPLVAGAVRSFAPGAETIVAAGLGGLVAVAVAARHPSLVRRLVLIDALPPAEPIDGTADANGTDHRDDIAVVPASSLEELIAVTAAASPATSCDVIALLAGTDATRTEDGGWAWRDHFRSGAPLGPSLGDPSLWDDLAATTCPLVVIRTTGRPGAARPTSDRQVGNLHERRPDAAVVDVDTDIDGLLTDRVADLAAVIDRTTAAPRHADEADEGASHD